MNLDDPRKAPHPRYYECPCGNIEVEWNDRCHCAGTDDLIYMMVNGGIQKEYATTLVIVAVRHFSEVEALQPEVEVNELRRMFKRDASQEPDGWTRTE